MTSRIAAVYSVAYLQHGRDGLSPIHWYAWAAWLVEPTGRPWVRPFATGRVCHAGPGQVEHARETAEIEADDALRAELGASIETRRICDSFARAAFREANGEAPNWRAPRPTKYRYAQPRGFSRPPRVTAREFFAACFLPPDLGFRERIRDFAAGRLQAALPSEALATLGLAVGASAHEIRRAYRLLALKTHPDRGGSPEAFRAITAARDAALAAVRQ